MSLQKEYFELKKFGARTMKTLFLFIMCCFKSNLNAREKNPFRARSLGEEELENVDEMHKKSLENLHT